MLVKLDDEVLYEIDDTMMNLLGDEILDPLEDIKRRLRWIIEHKCDQCFLYMEKQWMDKLRADPEVKSIPIDKREFVKMIVSRPDYQNRKMREDAAQKQG